VVHYEQVAGPLKLKDAYRQRRAWQRRGKRTPHRVAGERTDHHYHVASKHIVALAAEHRARVGVEDLSYRRTKTGRKAINRKLFAAPVGRLASFLSYKLPFAGLPRPVKVHGISPRECHRCGRDSRDKTKRAEGHITCPLCGLEMDEHENTARLVAAQLPAIQERITAARQRRQS
jgi:IS605 OrfB family transposase